jgi:5-formyltetrahydrofolate cyclo-ligase
LISKIDKTARKELIAKRNAMDAGERASLTIAISEKAIQLIRHLACDGLMGYASFRGEPDILPTLAQIGLPLYLPRITGPGTMVFYQVTDLQQLKANRFGIKEPDENCQELPLTDEGQKYAVLIPCVAASLAGIRIGYGRGYYDRFLTGWKHGVKIGITFDAYLCDEILAETHDIRLDYIISECKVWDAKNQTAITL